MGGPGRGIPFDTRDVPTSSVTIAFNPDRPTRPYSLRDATDPDTPIRGKAGWDRDVRERPRTFATTEAAEAFARSHAAAPLVIQHVVLVPQYEPTADDRALNAAAKAAASQFVGELQSAVDSGDVERFREIADRPVMDRMSEALQAGGSAGSASIAAPDHSDEGSIGVGDRVFYRRTERAGYGFTSDYPGVVVSSTDKTATVTFMDSDTDSVFIRRVSLGNVRPRSDLVSFESRLTQQPGNRDGGVGVGAAIAAPDRPPNMADHNEGSSASSEHVPFTDAQDEADYQRAIASARQSDTMFKGKRGRWIAGEFWTDEELSGGGS